MPLEMHKVVRNGYEEIINKKSIPEIEMRIYVKR